VGTLEQQKKNLYELLEVAQNASIDVLDAAHKISINKYKTHAENGNQDARNQMIAISEAYRILRDPMRRMAYDLSLEKVEKPDSQILTFKTESIYSDWWSGRKSTLTLFGVFLIMLIYATHNYYATKAAERTHQLELQKLAEMQQKQLDAEKEQADARAAQQAEYQKRAYQAQIDRDTQLQTQMQLQRDEARSEQILAAQQRSEQIAKAQQQSKQMVQQMTDANRLAAERAYYACINSMPDLRARQFCHR